MASLSKTLGVIISWAPNWVFRSFVNTPKIRWGSQDLRGPPQILTETPGSLSGQTAQEAQGECGVYCPFQRLSLLGGQSPQDRCPRQQSPRYACPPYVRLHALTPGLQGLCHLKRSGAHLVHPGQEVGQTLRLWRLKRARMMESERKGRAQDQVLPDLGGKDNGAQHAGMSGRVAWAWMVVR